MAAIVESGGLALSVLEAADIAPDDLIDELRARRARDGGDGALDAALVLAVEQARGLGHSYVGTEHFLLALTAGPTRELARRTLADMGLKHEQALRGVATALSAYSYARESITFAGISAPIRAALEDIRSRLARLELATSPEAEQQLAQQLAEPAALAPVGRQPRWSPVADHDGHRARAPAGRHTKWSPRRPVRMTLSEAQECAA